MTADGGHKPARAWQRMLSGRRLDLLNPDPADIEIEDIAHGLARVARWNGQTVGAHAFSVAQHALVVERIADGGTDWGNDWRLAALLHDAAEYVVAIEKGRLPIEQHEMLTAERALEEELFLGLRQLDGIDVGKIERAYGVRLASRFDPLALNGLVERDGDVVRLAPGKLSVSNEVFVELMR